MNMTFGAQNMLEISSLSVHYGPVQALSSVSLNIATGEIVALLGSNGAGKSTLMRGINGLSAASAGDIIFEGKRINGIPAERRPQLGLASILEGRGMLPRMSVLENLQMGAYLRRGDGLDEELESVFKMFPVLRERVSQSAGTLSGGEQQMLAFGRAILMRPKLILMDEPSMGLAPIIVERVFDAIKQINKNGATILLVEQNVRMALSIAEKFYVLSAGVIVREGIAKGGELLVNKGNGKFVSVKEEDLEAAYLEGK
jgi:branched-chain amino acid transport system ATP-binding protein